MSTAVSVILPCFNHEDFVREAVASVLHQTFSDLEIIAIDDASTDSTYEALESLDDSRIRLFQHDRKRGTARTINEGIRRARGNYISILNADHAYHPERLKYCLEMTETHNLYMIGTDIDLIADGEEASTGETKAWLEEYGRVKNQYLDWQDIGSALVGGDLFVTPSNFFCRKSLFDAIGPIADYRHAHGYDFTLRAAVAYPRRIHWSEHRMLGYRLRGDAALQPGARSVPREELEVLTHMIPHLAQGKPGKERLRIFEDRVVRLANEVESGAQEQTRQDWQTDVAVYQQRVDDGKKTLQRLEKKMSAELAQAQSESTSADQRSSSLDRALQETRAELEESQQRLDAAQSEGSTIARELLASRKKEEAAESHNRTLANRVDELAGALAEQQHLLQVLSSSRSYRWGHALLQPLRLIRRFFGLFKRSTPVPEETGTRADTL
ncbi:MAG: glycosyltransferase [Myxococcota bacterium]|nr:glycosyltransferase [Myxococcota bacterium]